MFNGFENVAAYRRECERIGLTTKIQKCVKNGEIYNLLITSSKTGDHPSWHLFDENEVEMLTDIVHQFDYKTQLQNLGYSFN